MTVTAYATLRENLARRDRSLREKVMSLEEAVSFVRDGDCVGIGGSTMSLSGPVMADGSFIKIVGTAWTAIFDSAA